MEFSLPALIGISLATMFFGYFFGLFEGRGQGYKRGRREEADVQSAKATLAAPQGGPPSDERNLLALRMEANGAPSLRIDGQRVASSEVTPGLRKRLIDLMVMLRPWVEPSATSPSPAPQAAAAGHPVDPRYSAGEKAATGLARGQTPSTSPPTSQPTAPGAMSLVQQIDSVLQERLAGTPLASRGIRLAEALHGGATVFIGQHQYDGVEKVPDADVQAAIRAAIAEWEKRFTPG